MGHKGRASELHIQRTSFNFEVLPLSEGASTCHAMFLNYLGWELCSHIWLKGYRRRKGVVRGLASSSRCLFRTLFVHPGVFKSCLMDGSVKQLRLKYFRGNWFFKSTLERFQTYSYLGIPFSKYVCLFGTSCRFVLVFSSVFKPCLTDGTVKHLRLNYFWSNWFSKGTLDLF